MRQLHESSFSVAQSSGSVLLRRAFRTEWNHRGFAGHYETACVTSSTYYQHIYHIYLLHIPHRWLCVEIPVVSLLILRRLIVEDKCHTPPHPQSHLDKACGAEQHWHLWFFFFWVCWWICKMSLIFLGPCSILLFSTLAGLLSCFSWCAVRERGQPHPSAEWHSMRGRKGVEKSCLVFSLMSKSMHLSFKRCEREKKTEKLLGLQGSGQNTHTEAVTTCYE